jgi:hypothetical protein
MGKANARVFWDHWQNADEVAPAEAAMTGAGKSVYTADNEAEPNTADAEERVLQDAENELQALEALVEDHGEGGIDAVEAVEDQEGVGV